MPTFYKYAGVTESASNGSLLRHFNLGIGIYYKKYMPKG